jgi:hypothetical protein
MGNGIIPFIRIRSFVSDQSGEIANSGAHDRALQSPERTV